MLEVRPSPDGFTVYHTESNEAIVTFPRLAEADELIASMQGEEMHAQLARWSPDPVPAAY
jgi:hypothetical protein